MAICLLVTLWEKREFLGCYSRYKSLTFGEDSLCERAFSFSKKDIHVCFTRKVSISNFFPLYFYKLYVCKYRSYVGVVINSKEMN